MSQSTHVLVVFSIHRQCFIYFSSFRRTGLSVLLYKNTHVCVSVPQRYVVKCECHLRVRCSKEIRMNIFRVKCICFYMRTRRLLADYAARCYRHSFASTPPHSISFIMNVHRARSTLPLVF